MPTLDRQLACLLIPEFPLRVELLRHPELDGAPAALAYLAARRRIITSCSDEAGQLGVRPGMSVREAVGLCPELRILSADPVHYAQTFARLVEQVSQISPLVEPAELGCAYVDLAGLTRLFGDIDAITTALLAAIPAILRPRLGIADTKFTARVAALKAPPGGVRIIDASESAAFLAPCPVSVLPVSPGMVQRFDRLGLRRLGDLARLPRSALQAQFGPEGGRAWDLAIGQDQTPLKPIEPEIPVSDRLDLPAPTIQFDLLLTGVWLLVNRLFGRPELTGVGIRQARLQLLLEGQQSWERVVHLKGSVADPARIIRILSDRLQAVHLPAPVTTLVIELAGRSPATAQQVRLPGLRSRRRAPLASALQELSERFGRCPIYRVVEVEPWSRIPERRHALMRCDPSMFRSA